MLLLVAALLGGCLDSAKNSSHGGSAAGSWQLENATGCTQELSLADDDEFAVASWMQRGGLVAVHQMQGTLSGGLTGRFTATLHPDYAVPAGLPVYCAQWSQAAPILLPTGDAETTLGVDPLDLVYTPSLVAGLGVVLTGTDSTRRDQMILYRQTSGKLVAIQAADPTDYPNGIYRALPSDALPTASDFPTLTEVTLPRQFWQSSYSGTTSNDVLIRLILIVASAAKVTFSRFPGSNGTACAFVLYEDTNFANLYTADPLSTGVNSQSRLFNPLDPGWPFAQLTVGSNTAYAIPVVVRSPADGDCEAYVSAHAIADDVAAAHAAATGAATLFSVGTPGSATALEGHPPTLARRLTRIGLTGSPVPLLPISLNGVLVFPPETFSDSTSSASSDPLHLTSTSSARPLFSVSAGGAAMNIFPESGAMNGWGPFMAANPAGATLGVPDVIALTASTGGYRTQYRLHVPASERVALWTDGGIVTSGQLLNAWGRTIAMSAGGANDGAGFRIEADLTAGDYTLMIGAAAGSFTLNTQALATSATFSDAALDACMVESGWALTPGQPVTTARCADQGIRSIDDLDQAADLQVVDLSNNGIEDITDLQNLPQLRTVLLAGNPVHDISALAGIGKLQQLSLANTAIDASSLSTLEALGDRLAFLDLTGVSGLTDTEVSDLHAAMPFTQMVDLTGSLMP